MMHPTFSSHALDFIQPDGATGIISKEAAARAPTVHAISTLPSGSSGEPSWLIAALGFMESVGDGRMGAPELGRWFDQHLVRYGRLPRPTSIYERSTGTISLDIVSETTVDLLARALADARQQVVRTLRGLVLTPQDDRFLVMLASRGRVWPARLEPRRLWVPRPHILDSLSDIVLSLFAADILSNRSIYDSNLSVCDACGRISFAAQRALPTRCREHLPASPARFVGPF